MDLERSNKEVFTTSFQRHPNFRRSTLVPVEILVEIFLLSLPPTNLRQAPRRTTLALVCRLWNDIIEGTPVLWSRISFKDGISHVKRSLRKSAESPIDVYGVRSDLETRHSFDSFDVRFDFGRDSFCGYGVRGTHHSLFDFGRGDCSQCCLPLFREVGRHSDRWRRVVLLVVDKALQVALAPTHSPYLEFLGLFWGAGDVESSSYHTLLTSSRAPRLRTLILGRINFARWDISFPPTLSCLVIQELRISSRQILTVLAASPNLSVLHLSQLSALKRNDGAPDSAVVELTSLRKLTFNEVEGDAIQDVMPRLKFPSDCKVSLKCALPYGRDPRVSFLDPVLSQYRDMFQRVGEIVRVRISYEIRGSYVILQFLRWDIILQRLPNPPEVLDILEWFGIGTNKSDAALHSENLPINSILPLSNIPVSLEFCDGYSWMLHWQRPNPLLNLGWIGRIKLGCMTFYTYGDILSHLAKPLVTPSPATTTSASGHEPAGNSGSEVAMQHVAETWPFPGLCELAVQSSEDFVLRAVTELVKARWPSSGVGLGHNRAASGRSPAAQPPARLKGVGFGWEDDTSPESERRRHLPSDVKAWPSALLDLLDVLAEEIQVFWFGKRISKAGIMD